MMNRQVVQDKINLPLHIADKSLHEFDQHDLDIIVAERLPAKNLGLAINDRLTRATK